MITVEEMKDNGMFEFLDNLRESGQINMFGASPVIAEVFGLDKKLSREVVSAWMKNFGKSDDV
jgi:hypothetical protein